MQTKRRFLYAHVDPTNGCCQHRLILPFRYNWRDFPDLDFDLSATDPVGPYHYLCTLGVPTLSNVGYYGNWQRNGGKWVWVIDDDYTRLPDFNPLQMGEKELDLHEVARNLADVIWVSTQHLANTIGRPQKTLVSPNLMEVASYGVTDVAPVVEGEPLRVMWAGSKTHGGDLTVIEPAVSELLRKWGRKVEFIFVGSVPDRLLRDHLNNGVHFEKGVPLAVYPNLLRNVRPHVVLAPLCDHVFNLSKSAIRVYEGWSLAAAVVASPVGEYRVVRDGTDGLVAATESDWFVAIDRLLSDREYREQIAREGRRRVAAEFDWDNYECREPWRKTIRELAYRVGL